ncbi:MAG: BA14K family protein [Caulobacteraceae bacterium]
MKRSLVLGAISVLGLMAAACANDYPPPPVRGYPPPPPPRPSYADHVDWCFKHHDAYNPQTNVYIAHDGSPHYCVEH